MIWHSSSLAEISEGGIILDGLSFVSRSRSPERTFLDCQKFLKGETRAIDAFRRMCVPVLVRETHDQTTSVVGMGS